MMLFTSVVSGLRTCAVAMAVYVASFGWAVAVMVPPYPTSWPVGFSGRSYTATADAIEAGANAVAAAANTATSAVVGGLKKAGRKIKRFFNFYVAVLVRSMAEPGLVVIYLEMDAKALVIRLLMDLPASPKHVVCPQPVKLRVADADYQEPEDKPNPFAALAGLKIPKG